MQVGDTIYLRVNTTFSNTLCKRGTEFTVRSIKDDIVECFNPTVGSYLLDLRTFTDRKFKVVYSVDWWLLLSTSLMITCFTMYSLMFIFQHIHK